MTNLWMAFAALSAIALLFVCYPFFRSTRRATGKIANATAVDANVKLFEEHMADLEQQHKRSEITADELKALRLEAERGLLSDSEQNDNQSKHREKSQRAPRKENLWLLCSLLLAVPACALLIYQHLGASEDIAIVERLEQSSRLRDSDPTQASIVRKDLLQRIERRLQQQPGNFYYWLLSARLNTEQQQLKRALQAYRRADQLSSGEDVTLLQEQLQVVFEIREGDNRAELKSLADRILALESNNWVVLGLRGRVAFSQGDYRSAITDWSRLLEALPSEGEVAKQLVAELENARQKLSVDDVAEMARSRIQLRVSIAANLLEDVQEAIDGGNSGVLFIIARPVGQDGGPPLAVKRLPVTGLPLDVVLDDSNLMLPGSTLADVPELSVVARISRSGAVRAQPGDWQGQLQTAVGVDSVDLVINKKL